MRRINRILFSVAFLITGFSVHAQNEYFIESEFLNSTPSFLLGLVPDIPAIYDVDFYKITYNTVDVDGNPTIASGSVAVPNNAECNSLPTAIYCHGTVLRQNDVPSEDNTEGFLTKVFAGTGYIVAAPDYIGLGVNEGIHPYVHAESEATATIDMIYATSEFIESLTVSSTGETLITGYSQGGHAAMAALEYAENENLNEELGIVAGAPCSGPYNISESQADVILSGDPYSNPGYIVYVLTSYQLAYGNIYENLSDIIQAPYDEEVAPYFDGMQDQYDMGTVNAILPGTIDEMMVDTVLDNFENNPNHPLWVALNDNDNYDWTPQIPLRMFYCTGDEQVAFENSIVADETMSQNGAEDVEAINSLPGANHGACILPALTDVFEFFSQIAPPCAVLGTEYQKPLKLSVYPNPSSGVITISNKNTNGIIAVQNISGQLVHQSNVSSAQTNLDLSFLPAGVYIVSLQAENQLYRNRIVIQ